MTQSNLEMEGSSRLAAVSILAIVAAAMLAPPATAQSIRDLIDLVQQSESASRSGSQADAQTTDGAIPFTALSEGVLSEIPAAPEAPLDQPVPPEGPVAPDQLTAEPSIGDLIDLVQQSQTASRPGAQADAQTTDGAIPFTALSEGVLSEIPAASEAPLEQTDVPADSVVPGQIASEPSIGELIDVIESPETQPPNAPPATATGSGTPSVPPLIETVGDSGAGPVPGVGTDTALSEQAAAPTLPPLTQDIEEPAGPTAPEDAASAQPPATLTADQTGDAAGVLPPAAPAPQAEELAFEPLPDVVTEEEVNLLLEGGIIQRQQQIANALLLIDREVRLADQAKELMARYGPDVDIPVGPNQYINMGDTPVGMQSRIDYIKLQMDLLEQQTAFSDAQAMEVLMTQLESIVTDEQGMLEQQGALADGPELVTEDDLIEISGAAGNYIAQIAWQGGRIAARAGDELPTGQRVVRVAMTSITVENADGEQQVFTIWE
jgi:hypothetical protein